MTPPIHYRYRDASGKRLYSVVRHTPKRFELLGPTDRPIAGFPGNTVLYRLPELIAADADQFVYVCEGEKDTDRLIGLGHVATTNPGGCRVGWKDEYAAYFDGRTVVVLQDNDRPGIRHAEAVLDSLRRGQVAALILPLPRLRRAEDVSDWLDFRGGTPAELAQLTAKLFAKFLPAAPSQSPGGHKRRHAIFESGLATAERIILLAIQHYSGSGGRLSAADVARMTGMHRVTAQRLLSGLRERGVLERTDVGWMVVYDRLPPAPMDWRTALDRLAIPQG